MRLRDIEEIEIGSPQGFYSGMEEFMDEYNSTIKDIKKESENKLKIILLLKKNTKSEGSAYIKTKTEKGKVVLDKILKSDKIVGKTLNEFGSINSEDL